MEGQRLVVFALSLRRMEVLNHSSSEAQPITEDLGVPHLNLWHTKLASLRSDPLLSEEQLATCLPADLLTLSFPLQHLSSCHSQVHLIQDVKLCCAGRLTHLFVSS